jgi:hypothetical protein
VKRLASPWLRILKRKRRISWPAFLFKLKKVDYISNGKSENFQIRLGLGSFS